MVAHRAEPYVSRGRELRRPPERARSAQGRPVPATGGGPPGGQHARPADARDDLEGRDAALAAPPRSADLPGAAGRHARVHRPDGPLPRDPDVPARPARAAGRLLRRRRPDEPARVRRHGHGLQLLPRGRSVRVRPRDLELRGGAPPAPRARRSTGGGGALGRGPGVLPAAPRGEGARRLLLRVRRQVPPGVDARAGGRAVSARPADRLRARRPRLPGRRRRGAHPGRRPVQRLRARDLRRLDQPQHHAARPRDRRRLVDLPAVRARVGRSGDRLQPARRAGAVVRAGGGDRRGRRRGRRPRGVPRAPRRPRDSGGDGGASARAGARERVLDEHTYAHRARQVLHLLELGSAVPV